MPYRQSSPPPVRFRLPYKRPFFKLALHLHEIEQDIALISNLKRKRTTRGAQQVPAVSTLDLSSCAIVLLRLRNHEFGHLFNQAVAKSQWPEEAGELYQELVHTPIDLGLVQARLSCGEYTHSVLFADDVRTVLKNGAMCARPDSPLQQQAMTLWRMFEDDVALYNIAATEPVAVPHRADSDPDQPLLSAALALSSRGLLPRHKKIGRGHDNLHRVAAAAVAAASMSASASAAVMHPGKRRRESAAAAAANDVAGSGLGPGSGSGSGAGVKMVFLPSSENAVVTTSRPRSRKALRRRCFAAAAAAAAAAAVVMDEGDGEGEEAVEDGGAPPVPAPGTGALRGLAELVDLTGEEEDLMEKGMDGDGSCAAAGAGEVVGVGADGENGASRTILVVRQEIVHTSPPVSDIEELESAQPAMSRPSEPVPEREREVGAGPQLGCAPERGTRLLLGSGEGVDFKSETLHQRDDDEDMVAVTGTMLSMLKPSSTGLELNAAGEVFNIEQDFVLELDKCWPRKHGLRKKRALERAEKEAAAAAKPTPGSSRSAAERARGRVRGKKVTSMRSEQVSSFHAMGGARRADDCCPLVEDQERKEKVEVVEVEEEEAGGAEEGRGECCARTDKPFTGAWRPRPSRPSPEEVAARGLSGLARSAATASKGAKAHVARRVAPAGGEPEDPPRSSSANNGLLSVLAAAADTPQNAACAATPAATTTAAPAAASALPTSDLEPENATATCQQPGPILNDLTPLEETSASRAGKNALDGLALAGLSAVATAAPAAATQVEAAPRVPASADRPCGRPEGVSAIVGGAMGDRLAPGAGSGAGKVEDSNSDDDDKKSTASRCVGYSWIRSADKFKAAGVLPARFAADGATCHPALQGQGVTAAEGPLKKRAGGVAGKSDGSGRTQPPPAVQKKPQVVAQMVQREPLSSRTAGTSSAPPPTEEEKNVSEGPALARAASAPPARAGVKAAALNNMTRSTSAPVVSPGARPLAAAETRSKNGAQAQAVVVAAPTPVPAPATAAKVAEPSAIEPESNRSAKRQKLSEVAAVVAEAPAPAPGPEPRVAESPLHLSAGPGAAAASDGGSEPPAKRPRTVAAAAAAAAATPSLCSCPEEHNKLGAASTCTADDDDMARLQRCGAGSEPSGRCARTAGISPATLLELAAKRKARLSAKTRPAVAAPAAKGGAAPAAPAAAASTAAPALAGEVTKALAVDVEAPPLAAASAPAPGPALAPAGVAAAGDAAGGAAPEARPGCMHVARAAAPEAPAVEQGAPAQLFAEGGVQRTAAAVTDTTTTAAVAISTADAAAAAATAAACCPGKPVEHAQMSRLECLVTVSSLDCLAAASASASEAPFERDGVVRRRGEGSSGGGAAGAAKGEDERRGKRQVVDVEEPVPSRSQMYCRLSRDRTSQVKSGQREAGGGGSSSEQERALFGGATTRFGISSNFGRRSDVSYPLLDSLVQAGEVVGLSLEKKSLKNKLPTGLPSPAFTLV